MSRDVLEMVQEMDQRSLKWHLAMQCAPLLTGLKISNLFMVPRSSEKAICCLLDSSDISYFILRENSRKLIMLLYRKKELCAFLADPAVKEILYSEGYPEGDLSDILSELRRRYLQNRDCSGVFPHEMGVFLGYPPEDVRGFIDNRGKDFLYCGYWKVYARPEEKKRIFDAYEEARDTVIQCIHEGVSLREILGGRCCGLSYAPAVS